MHLQVGILDVQRQAEPFALNRIRQGRGDVEIQGVAELVGLRRPAGLDAGGEIASIVTSEAGLTQRSQQVAQRLEAEEVEALVGDFEFCLLRFASLSANARLPRRVVRLVDGNVIFLLHALDELLDQFIELAFGEHLLNLLAQVLVEVLSIQQRLLDGALQFIERLLALGHFVPHVALKPTLQQVIRQGAKQVFHAHLAGGVGHVLGVTNSSHKSVVGLWSSVVGPFLCRLLSAVRLRIARYPGTVQPKKNRIQIHKKTESRIREGTVSSIFAKIPKRVSRRMMLLLKTKRTAVTQAAAAIVIR